MLNSVNIFGFWFLVLFYPLEEKYYTPDIIKYLLAIFFSEYDQFEIFFLLILRVVASYQIDSF